MLGCYLFCVNRETGGWRRCAQPIAWKALALPMLPGCNPIASKVSLPAKYLGGCNAHLASTPFDAYDRKPWPRGAASLGDRWGDAIDRPPGSPLTSLVVAAPESFDDCCQAVARTKKVRSKADTAILLPLDTLLWRLIHRAPSRRLGIGQDWLPVGYSSRGNGTFPQGRSLPDDRAAHRTA